MRKVIISIEASEQELELYEDEGEVLDPDSLFDYYIYETISSPNYTFKVVDDEGNDVTKEYKHS